LIENHVKVNGFDSDDPQHSNKKQGKNRPTNTELTKDMLVQKSYYIKEII